MGGQVVANSLNLLGQVAQESCGAVGGGGVPKADEVGICARVCRVGERCDGAEAVGFVVVAQAMPNDEW